MNCNRVSMVVLLLSGFAVAQSGVLSPHKPVGEIMGTVLDERSEPVEGAKLHVALKTGAVAKAIQYFDSDDHGSFAVPVWDFGTYFVYVGKESAGYPDSLFFYPEKVPVVEVTRENPNPRLVVDLGPKAAVLSGTVRDSKTGRPLSSGFNLHWVDQPKRFYSTSETPSFRLLVPPQQDITLDVTASGYEKWVYNAQPVLRLEPGARMHLDVVLERSHNGAFGHVQYLVPTGYVGWVRIRFDTQDGAAAVTEGGVTIVKVPSSGELMTSSPVPEIGACEEYLFLSPDDSTRPIPLDYWNDSGMIWGEHEVMRGGHRSEIDFLSEARNSSFNTYQKRNVTSGCLSRTMNRRRHIDLTGNTSHTALKVCETATPKSPPAFRKRERVSYALTEEVMRQCVWVKPERRCEAGIRGTHQSGRLRHAEFRRLTGYEMATIANPIQATRAAAQSARRAPSAFKRPKSALE